MQQKMAWAGRAFGFVWIGLLTIGTSLHAHDRRTLTIQIAGYAVIGAAMLGWALIETRTPPNTPAGRAMIFLLALVAGTSGFLCTSHNGALLVLFAAIAALIAGGDVALEAALAVAGVGIFGVMAGALAFGSTDAAALIGFPATMLSALFIGRHRRAYRVQAEQATALLERTRELQELQRHADVLDERTRIAREIHDVLAHSLGGLSIQIQAARAVLEDGNVGKALQVLDTAQRIASDGLVETKRAVHALRADIALDQELSTLTKTHNSQYGSEVDLRIDGEPRELPPAATMALLRVAQEALVNAAKHAAGEPIGLILAYDDGEVRLTVTNAIADGAPSALKTVNGGYGLTGMKERLLLIGGSLDAERRDDTWTVVATAPTPGPGPGPAPAPGSAPASASASASAA
ncbi:sensor histidine kinase [Catenulispora subtropica]|uniref:histidine kinase n=1 Tax=Catenulispora subtropica TaxID=450798 RepID=A0ABP5DR71_9ACTN